MKYLKYIVPVVIVGLITVIGLWQRGDVALGGPVDNAQAVPLDGAATTSVVYLTVGGAASEKVFSTVGYNRFSIDTQLIASTTNTVGVFTLKVSQGNNCISAPTTCDWYDLPNVTTDSGIANTVGSTTATYSITPQLSTSSTTKYSILINPSDHKFFKITRSVTGAAGAVWQQIVPTVEF